MSRLNYVCCCLCCNVSSSGSHGLICDYGLSWSYSLDIRTHTNRGKEAHDSLFPSETTAKLESAQKTQYTARTKHTKNTPYCCSNFKYPRMFWVSSRDNVASTRREVGLSPPVIVPKRCFFCGAFMLFLSCFLYAFVRVCGHLLGKG